MENPVLVEVCRNGVVESWHRGSAVVFDADGDMIYQAGEVNRSIYPRSSLKFFQAIPLVESGAAQAFGLGLEEIALACASHNAESIHIKTLVRWLEKIGLPTQALENGAEYPLFKAEKNRLIRENIKANQLHHNCSGKHIGMLNVARHLGLETSGYSEHTHPTQRLWMQAFSELAEIDVQALPWERDGCGLAAIYMPIQALARACAKISRVDKLKGVRRQTMQTILGAVAAHPQMIAGTNRCCTDVIKATRGEVLVKTGAEAVYIAVVAKLGLGLALKIDDGSTRACNAALGALLLRINAIDSSLYDSLHQHFKPEIMNSQGYKTGEIRALMP